MAGPQFLTPKPVSPSRPVRRFTLRQANSALPLVMRVVSDIVRSHDRVKSLQAMLREGLSGKHQQTAQAEIENSLGHLQDYLDELTEIGCEVKDYKIGLVDFIGRHKGHDVCLCWKLGEEQIEYWHEINTGFAGRQGVASLKEDE